MPPNKLVIKPGFMSTVNLNLTTYVVALNGLIGGLLVHPVEGGLVLYRVTNDAALGNHFSHFVAHKPHMRYYALKSHNNLFLYNIPTDQFSIDNPNRITVFEYSPCDIEST